MDIDSALAISAAGMAAEATRLRVVAENLANADTTGAAPGADPYRRRVVSFVDRLDRASGTALVAVRSVGAEPGAFPKRYEPGHPAADAEGYVKMPNVDGAVEMADMREAEHSYAANLAVLQVSRTMLSRTIAMLK